MCVCVCVCTICNLLLLTYGLLDSHQKTQPDCAEGGLCSEAQKMLEQKFFQNQDCNFPSAIWGITKSFTGEWMGVGVRGGQQLMHTMAFNCTNKVDISYCFLRASSTKASIDSGRSTAEVLVADELSKTEYRSCAAATFCTFHSTWQFGINSSFTRHDHHTLR